VEEELYKKTMAGWDQYMNTKGVQHRSVERRIVQCSKYEDFTYGLVLLPEVVVHACRDVVEAKIPVFFWTCVMGGGWRLATWKGTQDQLFQNIFDDRTPRLHIKVVLRSNEWENTNLLFNALLVVGRRPIDSDVHCGRK
jgi:hypothetical protein